MVKIETLGCSQEFVHTIDEHVSSGLDVMPFLVLLRNFRFLSDFTPAISHDRSSSGITL